MANGYIEGKAEEYSSKRAWSTIGEQCPEGKPERNPGNVEGQEPDSKATQKDNTGD